MRLRAIWGPTLISRHEKDLCGAWQKPDLGGFGMAAKILVVPSPKIR